MKFFKQYFLLILYWSIAYQCVAEETTFSAIKEAVTEFQLSVSGTPDVITYPLKSRDGRELYWLHCVAGNDTALDALSSKTGINFVAPFACRLSEDAQTNSEQSLLSETADTAYWHSRARFTLQSLQPPCSDDPAYGATRSFSLRGFELTLAVRDVQRTAEKTEFKLQVNVKSDSSAHTERAKPVQPSSSRCQV